VAQGVGLGVPLGFEERSFFQYVFGGLEPEGEYLICLAATSTGALADGRLGPGELLLPFFFVVAGHTADDVPMGIVFTLTRPHTYVPEVVHPQDSGCGGEHAIRLSGPDGLDIELILEPDGTSSGLLPEGTGYALSGGHSACAAPGPVDGTFDITRGVSFTLRLTPVQ
jgi:hypothetical protein